MTVFTVITGGYDTLKDIRVRNDKCRYVCFTDDVNIDNKGWELIDIGELNPPANLSGRLLQRWVKIKGGVSYLKCDTVYLDGSHEIIGDVTELFEGKSLNITFKKHPVRDCYIDEAEACIRLRKGDPGLIYGQMTLYQIRGVPLKNGMFETGIIMRRFNEKVVDFSNRWWDEVYNHTCRDQISVVAVLFDTKLEIETFTQEQFLKYIKIHPHNG